MQVLTRTEPPGRVIQLIPGKKRFREVKSPGASGTDAPAAFPGDGGVRTVYRKMKSGEEATLTTDHWLQVLVVDGAVEVDTEDSGPFVVRAGELYFLDSGVTHTERALEESLVIVTAGSAAAHGKSTRGAVHRIPGLLQFQPLARGALTVQAAVAFQGGYGVKSLYFKGETGDTAGVHRHGWAQIFVISGAVEVGAEGSTPIVARAGDVCFIDEGALHYDLAIEGGLVIVMSGDEAAAA